MRHFTAYSFLALLVSFTPASVFAAPAPVALVGSSSGSSSALSSSGLSSALTNLIPSNTQSGNSESADEGNIAASPATGTTTSNPATISGLLDIANDAANIVGNTVETDTLSNNDNDPILDDNQIANIDIGGEQGSEKGNANGKGLGSWKIMKW